MKPDLEYRPGIIIAADRIQHREAVSMNASPALALSYSRSAQAARRELRTEGSECATPNTAFEQSHFNGTSLGD